MGEINSKKILKLINNLVESATGRRFQKNNINKSTDLIEHLDILRSNSIATHDGENGLLKSYLIQNFLKSKAQLFQDLWVLWELDNPKKGFFVEFGAFDGSQLSNTFFLEKECEWTGILAEPNPELHDSIENIRSAILDRRCVFDTSGKLIDLIITDSAEYSTIENYIDKDNHFTLRNAGRKFSVASVSLDDLLDENKAPSTIDYISIDTEGSEFEILQAYNWSRHVRCFSIEHNFTKNESYIDDLLKSKGYVRRYPEFSKWDGWYVHIDDKRDVRC